MTINFHSLGNLPHAKEISRSLSIVLLGAILLYPNSIYAFANSVGSTYMVTSVLYALPLLVMIGLLPKRWMYVVAAVVCSVVSIIDLTMVDIYNSYLLPGAIISTIKTNPQEAAEFYQTNLKEVWRWLPIIAMCVVSCLTYQRPGYNKWCWVASSVALLLPVGFVSVKITAGYHSALTVRYFVDNRILNRPPYNVYYQSVNAAKELHKRSMMASAKETLFGATRITPPVCEVYIVAIGESLRYDNLSLNGVYPRSTTPQLESMDNLILFDNYYSQACLTMYSVPMLITRATPQNYDLNFMERSIIEPFRECGFKTFTIVSNTNLLSSETYLSDGVDSLIVVPNIVRNGEIVSGDKTMIHIVDSLVQQHDKLFIMMQFLGNHSFYTNYEQEYDVYRPNANTCTPEERAVCDSLYINAYDNSILYTDYILSSIIRKIDRPNTISSFVFVSDHGEGIGRDGGGHGGNCTPKKEEYHVPFIFWYSDAYAEYFPDKADNAAGHKTARLNGDCIFYSVCDMANITLDSAYAQPAWSVFSDAFQEHERLILVPDGVTCIRVE